MQERRQVLVLAVMGFAGLALLLLAIAGKALLPALLGLAVLVPAGAFAWWLQKEGRLVLLPPRSS